MNTWSLFVRCIMLSLSVLLTACGGTVRHARHPFSQACRPLVESRNLKEELAATIEKFVGVSAYSAKTGTEGTFLVLVIPGIPLTADDVDPAVVSGAFSTSRQLGAAARLSRTLNLVAGTGRYWSSDGRILWDIYGTVLDEALVAPNQLSGADRQRLDAARTAIARTGDVYNRYRQAYEQARAEYVKTKLKEEEKADSNPLEWQAQEPGLRARVAAAYSDWLAKGGKSVFEEANAAIDQLQGRSPLLAWRQWKEEFRLAQRTDPDGEDFWLTPLQPASIRESGDTGPWTRFTITYPVASGNDSPDGVEELVSRREGRRPSPPVIHFSGELMRGEIIRPWLNPGLFRSPFWRWTTNREPLSDGQTPPRGTLVAYPTAVVLARDLEIQVLPKPRKGEEQDAEAEKPAPPPGTPPPNHGTGTDDGCNSLRFDGVQIIGFICRLLPRSPDPNPALTWEAPLPMPDESILHRSPVSPASPLEDQEP